ncbi:MAG: hypothetical protein LBC92_03040 [Rickettsiales bacterium]|nr:hypothetical protein [Rickettsiales bacterium]
MDNNELEKLEDIMVGYVESLMDSMKCRRIVLNGFYDDKQRVDLYLKECYGENWKKEKDESVKRIVGALMHAYSSSVKVGGGKDEILEKISNSKLDKEFLQEISQTLKSLKSGIDNGRFKDDSIWLGNTRYYADSINKELENSIKFIDKELNRDFELEKLEDIQVKYAESLRDSMKCRRIVHHGFYDDKLRIDLYLKECCGENWKNEKDKSVKRIAGALMHAYSSSVKEKGGKDEILEKISNSKLDKEFLQEISQTLKSLKSGIDNGRFSVDKNGLICLGNRGYHADLINKKLKNSIEFIDRELSRNESISLGKIEVQDKNKALQSRENVVLQIEQKGEQLKQVIQRKQQQQEEKISLLLKK